MFLLRILMVDWAGKKDRGWAESADGSVQYRWVVDRKLCLALPPTPSAALLRYAAVA